MPEASVSAVVTAFGNEGAAALLSLIVAINTWNTIGSPPAARPPPSAATTSPVPTSASTFHRP